MATTPITSVEAAEVPKELVAVTVIEYFTPICGAPSVHEVVTDVQVKVAPESGTAVTL
jgi:hypothetical protein